MTNSNKQNSHPQDFKFLVRKFIEENSEELPLTVYHISLLKVIAEYCDMQLGYCCLSFKLIEKFSGMGERKRQRTMKDLIKWQLITQCFVNNKPRHYMGKYFQIV